MAYRDKTPKTPDTGRVLADKVAYMRQVDRQFGKDYGEANRLFDPALPEDKMLQKSLAPWVPKTAMWNLIMRGRNRPDKAVARPLNTLESVWLKAVRSNQAATEKRGPMGPRDIPAIRKAIGERILGKKGEAYRQGLADPNRPMRDWDAQRVSPKFYNPKTGRYDLLPGVR